jgi:hypothetical protein
MVVAPSREVGTWQNLILVGIWTAFWGFAVCVKVVLLVQMIKDRQANPSGVAILLALAALETAVLVWSIGKMKSIWSCLRLVRSFEELKQLAGD